jgi:ZIP family zinc transporter
MGQAVAFAAIASSALVIGGLIGAYKPPPRAVTAALLAFAAGALITALAFDLFQHAVEIGGAWRAGAGLLVGATVFIVADTWLDRRVSARKARGGAVGFALLAAVTLDGVPENLAMGVTLIEDAGVTLLVAIFASNLPESIVGAQKMRENSMDPGRIVGIWAATAVLLAISVVVGYAGLEGVDDEALAWPLGFAGGAVLASVAATLMPEAYSDAKEQPWIAWATALGFLLSFLVASA